MGRRIIIIIMMGSSWMQMEQCVWPLARSTSDGSADNNHKRKSNSNNDNKNYLTAGTDEVSMGMVTRVVYIPTWGGCRDPEAVSESRNKAGRIRVIAQGGWILSMTSLNLWFWSTLVRNSPNV